MLFSRGWILHTSTSISEKVFHKDMLVFRRQDASPPRIFWASVSFDSGDRMRIVGEESQADVVPAFRQVLQDMMLLQSEKCKSIEDSAWEFKLKGWPWRTTGEKSMSSRLLILKMLELLESLGWRLYASIRHCEESHHTRDEDSSKTDSWYIVKAKDWRPGMPVFHG